MTPCSSEVSPKTFLSSVLPPNMTMIGCGRFFEGTPAEMVTALSKLSDLPSDTKVYPGHEYTKQNVKFLKTVSSKTSPATSAAVDKLYEFAEREKETTGKTNMGQEREWNLFMRSGEQELEGVTGEKGKVEVMGKLREMKNNM